VKTKLFSYNYENTVIHNLSGVIKFICFLVLTFAVMYSYDIRVILAMLVFLSSSCASQRSNSARLK